MDYGEQIVAELRRRRLIPSAPFAWGARKRVETTPKASGCFMGGTRAVREEPGKQKPRSARFASRYGTAGVGILPKQRPSKYAAENEMYGVSSFGSAESGTTAGELDSRLSVALRSEC
jgi:hypothetical protein